MTKEAPRNLTGGHDLDSHHCVLLDWFLLTRARWLAGICRQNENQQSCLSKGARAGNHHEQFRRNLYRSAGAGPDRGGL